jgi:hypothetical protein
MKYSKFAIIAIAAVLTIGCNKQKAAIDDTEEATKEAIDARKAEVNADAKLATEQTDVNAKVDKAMIEANKVSAQAQLDADKKKGQGGCGKQIVALGMRGGPCLLRASHIESYPGIPRLVMSSFVCS